MHGGEIHTGWRPGRGFVASMSEPATPAAPAQQTSLGTTATTPSRNAWAEAHGAMTADYEARLAGHQQEAARFERSQGRRSDREWAQRQQTLATGRFGLRNLWAGRTELSGTPSYNVDWLTLDRPKVERGINVGGDRIANIVERRTGQRALANRGAALESEGFVLGALKEPPADETPEPTSTTAPFSSFPRGGLLPKGSQLSGVVLQPLTER